MANLGRVYDGVEYPLRHEACKARHRAYVQALAEGLNFTQAAHAVGVSKRTGKVWRNGRTRSSGRCERARLMLANSDSLVLLNQTATDASTLQSLFHWSDKHRSYFQNVGPACGLLKMGVAMVPFDSRIPT